MYGLFMRVYAVAVAGALVSALGVAGASASDAAARVDAAARAPHAPRASLPGIGHPAASSGTQLWAKRYNGSGFNDDIAHSVAVSLSGKTVVVTGQSYSSAHGDDYATVAYNATTGAQLWAKRYTSPGNNSDVAYSAAFSPDSGTVFVTGESFSANSNNDYLTIAYNASTGAQLWAKRYNGPGNYIDQANAVTVSPSGGTVFVAGYSFSSSSGNDYATIAYNAATGAQVWVKRYNGPGNDDDEASAVTVSPGGSTVFVTGESYSSSSGYDYATIAYKASTGAQLWVKRYNGPGDYTDQANAIAVSPSGGTVFVTGYSYGTNAGQDYATVAYSASTGAQLWVKRYNGSGNGDDEAFSVAASPTGSMVFVTGYAASSFAGNDYATIAYNASTGAQVWAKTYNGPGNSDDDAYSVAVSPSGSKVYVTGASASANFDNDYATIAYNASTGAQVWAKRYNGSGNSDDEAFSAAVNPVGGQLYVTGESEGSSTGYDYATVAYSG